MTNPNMSRIRWSERDSDELELDPEVVKDLDVSDDETGQIRGGCSGSGTVSHNATAPFIR